MRHGRLRNILAAGALTGLVLATIIAFAWQSTPVDAQPAAAGAPTADTLRAENEQLRQAVDTLQQREAAYQSQIESANQTILQLQEADNSQFIDADEDDDEWEEYEHEEYEHEEHGVEEHEGEHDDD